jgi:peptidoglycan/LPS O-acetylase OafA/YrhL
MDALAVGALVACLARQADGLERLARFAPAVLLVSGALVLGIAVRRGGLFGGDPAVEGLAFTPLAFAFGALLVMAVAPGWPRLAQALTAPWLGAAGRYAYGLYVLHYPVFRALEACGLRASKLPPLGGSRLPAMVLFAAVAGGATWLAALVSWHLLEKRFLAWKVYFPYGSPARSAGARQPG